VKSSNTTSIRLINAIWPVLVILLAILQLVFPYRGWVVLLLGVGAAFLLGYLHARSLAKGLQLTREMRFGWARVGDVLEERFQVVNDGWWPGNWIELTDHSTIPGHQANLVTGVNGQSKTTWVYQHVCTRRGLFTIGPTFISTGDLFGIFSISKYNPASASLLVTPPVLPLPSIQVAAGGRAGEGRTARKALEPSIIANGVRDYTWGENLRWIHWPTSARRDQLFIKVFDHTPTSDWWIILDLEKRLQYGEGQDSTEETGVTLAASLADRGIRSGIAVGLIANGLEAQWQPPQTGQSHLLQLLRSLALVSPGVQSMKDTLSYALSSLHQQSSLILITSEMSGEWLDPVLLLMQRGVVPTILLLDPESFGGEGSASGISATLSDLGIRSYIITPRILDFSSMARQQVNAWQWRTLATGRALPVHLPGDLTWKELA
jgi:uncharacterized protein (DUF58 family)